MQREKMVGWWGSSGEAQQLPLLPSHRLIQKICSPQHHKSRARIRRFSLCQRYMWGTGETGASTSGSIGFQTWWLFAEGIEVGMQTVSGRVWRADKLQTQQTNLEAFPDLVFRSAWDLCTCTYDGRPHFSSFPLPRVFRATEAVAEL